MDRASFDARLSAAAQHARDFARRFVVEPLPDAIRIALRLNSSYDGNPLRPDEIVFPEDGLPDKGRLTHFLTVESTADELWRDGWVPEWVDLSAISVRGPYTLIEATACGRFTNEDALLYHNKSGLAPFSVKGPVFPPAYVDGTLFSIHHREVAWSPKELQDLHCNLTQTWMLSLYGREFNDRALQQLPLMPMLRVLELYYAEILGVGLAGLAQFESLRHLRVHLCDSRPFTLAFLPADLPLVSLSLSGIAAGELVLPNLPMLDSLQLRFRSGGSTLQHALPCLRSLSLSGSDFSSSVVGSLLVKLPGLRSLHLRGTPVDDGIIDKLLLLSGLEFIDLIDTGISPTGLATVRGRVSRVLP